MSSDSSQQPDRSIERAGGSSSSDTKEVRTTIQTVGYAYSGPLPPPMVLREFEDILPGSAERIFKQFEMQAEHRRNSETTVIASNAFTQKLGAISAAIVGIGGMAGGIWLVAHGQSVTGFGTLVVALGSIAGTFLRQRGVQNSERSTKRSSPELKKD